MIWTIARREFFEKILDFRVIISFMIAIILSAIVTLVAGGEYQAKKGEYDKQVANQQSQLSDIKVYSEYHPIIFYPPSPLSVFSRGIDIPTPITVPIQVYDIPRYTASAAGLNPMMSIFSSIDIGTVVCVLFSLLVILLTFDSFSGEKERGTLRQTLSNPVGKGTILHGKFLGTLMILGVVVCLIYLVALIMLRGFSGITLSAEEYARVAIMAAVTLLYLGTFTALGIFSSIMLHRSSISLAVLLFVWFFVAVFQPNLNTYITSEIANRHWIQEYFAAAGKTECGNERALADLGKTHGNLFQNPERHIYGEQQSRTRSTYLGTSFGPVVMRTVVTDADYNILDFMIQQVRLYRRLGDCADQDYGIYKHLFSDRLDNELHRKRALDMFSPAALFNHATGILSQTDIDNIDAFFEQARSYRNQYLAYLDRRGIFSTDAQLYFSRLPKEQIDPVATAARIAHYDKDTSMIPWISNQASLDLRDTPAFGVRESNIISDTMKTAPIMGLFLLYLAGMFIITGWSIKSYDPR